MKKLEIKLDNISEVSIKSTAKRIGIYKNVFENFFYHIEQFKRNPKMALKMLRIKIVNLDKFLKHGYCWCDCNGKIENSEPFKVGDVGYINLIQLEGKDVPNIFLEMFAEDVGVELLVGTPVDIEFDITS